MGLAWRTYLLEAQLLLVIEYRQFPEDFEPGRGKVKVVVEEEVLEWLEGGP